jgi:cytochrome c oxidase subunit 2
VAHAAPLDYFTTSHGPASQPTLWLGWVFASIASLVCIVIAVLLIAALLRSRQSSSDIQRIERAGDGLRWVYVGTGISTVVLCGMAIYAVVALNAVANPTSAPTLTIRVTGYDWWWRADYDGFITANEIHIPVGQPVRLELQSADVIHSFWVPQLAGKTQMIPGRSNAQWLQADTPGIYVGQCAQFCGAQHAHMSLEVVAQTADEFSRWQAAQSHAAGSAADDVFLQHCAGCHAVRGTQANGTHGPDLTHLMSRRRIAAGVLDNTRDNLQRWITHPQQIKPGAAMPDTALSDQDANSLYAYLATLQ